MAEAVAVVGIVANIIQLVGFGSKVLKRLEEYQSRLGEIPEAFRHIKTELPVLLDALQETKASIEAGSMQDKSRIALLPAIKGCAEQIKALDDLTKKALPALGDSWARRSRKALGSLRYDAKVEKITAVVRGYIQTLTYHAATSLRPLADRTLARPAPSSTVPFRRDPHFVDRHILSEIHSKSQQSAFRTALVGLGGVGKSQLAIEYSYQVREKSPATWVFWVHASTRARFEEGYQKIAERARLPSWDHPDGDILKLVHSWLCDEANGRWVMIIDNADDLGVFPRSSQRSKSNKDDSKNATASLLEFLPQSTNGSILITSRSREVAFRLTGSYADIIRVQPMDQAHALALLRNKLEERFEQDDAAALVEALDYMPLAITQAAAYISRRAPRATMSRYLQDLRKGDQERGKLLEMDIDDSRRDGAASNSIIATWQISFEHIRTAKPSAARLLSLMSLFDRQGIPESLVSGRYQEDNNASPDFEDDLNTLTSFSLVATDVDGHQFEMHRLVQFSTRKWLELQGGMEGWREKYVKLMDDSYPVGRYENWKVCQALFPHAQATVACRPASNGALETWASVLFKAAWYADDMGNYDVAQEMGRSALEARETALGANHLDTLSSVSNLGLVLEKQGKYEEAEAMHRRALEGYEKELGRDHSHTLTSVSNLGLVLESQGKYGEAEAMHRRDLEGSEKVLGRDHPDTLTSASNLGLVLERQGKYKEAEAMHRRDLEGSKKVLGRDHPDTLTSISNLGLVLEKQGKYEEAEAMHRRALEAREKVLGRDHPGTLISISNLGLVLEGQGKYEEAKAMHRRDLEGSEKVLGRDHPDTLTSVSNLGLVLERQGKYEEAEAMHRQALEAREKVLRRDHPDTLTSVSNLGLVLERRGKYEEAKAMHRRDLEGSEKVLGRDHPDTLTSISNLGLVLERQGKYEEAEAMHRQALEAREKVLGRDHPDTLTSVSNLGLVLERQGKYENAKALHQRALEAREKVLGQDHPDTLTSVSNLGLVLERQGKYEEAEAMHRQALEAREKVLGRDHPDTLTSVSNLGLVLEGLRKYEEAEVMHRRALKAREKVLGRDHPNTLISIGNLALTLDSQGIFVESERLGAEALSMKEVVFGIDHPETLVSMHNLAWTWRSQCRYDEAIKLMANCANLQRRKLGRNHPSTLQSLGTLEAWQN
ncbi:TPR-like protein [Lindgomyces ingoldianus]|uniref:TPR-like protein n=1 Tax=Lindgomyces ingoldianus TaxID=673940 RepID=A0ACB6R468_9PLEO|nr:TPR-like protein [Lindgomyces ingoldianus]KAF2473618.1 TPR-like protein [Lindgomyces ingoldianus]